MTGQLFVVTKGVFAGAVYAAPLPLRADRPNRLSESADAPGIVTDATFLPGGGAVVLRTYSSADVGGVPLVAAASAGGTLPTQDQGEGITVAGAELLLSTEGARSTVLAVDVPPAAAAADLAARPGRPALARHRPRPSAACRLTDA